MYAIERDRIGGPMVDLTAILNGPIGVGIGAVLAACAYQIREYHRERRHQEVFAGRVSPDARRARSLSSALQRCAITAGGDSVLLLWWEPTKIGGTVSAVAEWPGTLAPLGDLYDGLEQGRPYERDVIDVLSEHRWCAVLTSDLTPGSTLADLCSSRGIAVTWHREVLRDDGAVLYIALSYTTDDVDAETVRSALRSLSADIARMMT